MPLPDEFDHDVFLSYSHEDRAKAEELYRLMSQRQFAVYWDDQLRVGDDFPSKIPEAVRAASVVVVCWSRSAVASDWVLTEASIALKEGVLLPVVLEECDIPPNFEHLHAIDLTLDRGRLIGDTPELLRRTAELGGLRWNDQEPGLGWYANPLDAYAVRDRLTVTGIATGAEVRYKRDGEPYVTFRVGTAAGSIQCQHWNCDSRYPSGTLVELSGQVEEYNGLRRLKVESAGVRAAAKAKDPRRAVLSYFRSYVAATDTSGMRLGDLDDLVLLTGGQESMLTPEPGSYANLTPSNEWGDEEQRKLVRFVLERRAKPLLIGYPLVRFGRDHTEPLATMAVDLMRSVRGESRFVIRSTGPHLAWNFGAVERVLGRRQSPPPPISGESGLHLLQRFLELAGMSAAFLHPETLDGATQGMIVNDAVLFRPGEGPMSVNLLKDYDDLMAADIDQVTGSSLGALLETEPSEPPEIKPLVSFGPSLGPATLSQEEARRRAEVSRLTVVTGPPGTGKSQLIVNTVLATVEAGQTVIVASTNNHAVDAVLERSQLNQGPAIVTRAGARELDATVADQLAVTAYRRRAADPDPTSNRESAWQDLIQRTESIYSQADSRRLLEVDVVRLGRCIESLGDLLPGEVMSRLRDRSDDRLLISYHQLNELQRRFDDLPWWRFARRWTTRRSIGKARHSLASAAGMAEGDVNVAHLDGLSQALRWRVAIAAAESWIETIPLLAKLDDELTEVAGADRDARSRQRVDALAVDRASSVPAATIKAVATLEQTLPSDRKRLADIHRLMTKVIAAQPAWALTLHSARRFFPQEAGIVDLVIIDEASQCHPALAAPLMARARRAMIVGDPQQLPMVETTSEAERAGLVASSGLAAAMADRFAATSTLFDVAAQSIPEEPVLLDRHFRCHPEIAHFVNETFYGGRMQIRTRSQLDTPGAAMEWVVVRTSKPERARINEMEALEVVGQVRVLLSEGNRSIGVIAPFGNQVDLITRHLRASGVEDQSSVTVGTVHAFQGSERSIVVMSTVVGPSSSEFHLSFVNDAQMVNVAITRARNRLIVVGDPRPFENDPTSPLGALQARLLGTIGSLHPG